MPGDGARCQDTAQPAAYTSHESRCGRVAEALLVVAVGDRGAVPVEGALGKEGGNWLIGVVGAIYIVIGVASRGRRGVPGNGCNECLALQERQHGPVRCANWWMDAGNVCREAHADARPRRQVRG